MQANTAKIIVLGSASAVPDETHDNTHLLLVGNPDMILIDCPNSTYLRVKRAGYDPLMISDLILTHFHPDHVSGAAAFLMSLWLNKRENPLRVHGLSSTLDLFEKMMDLFDWHSWEKMYPVELNRLPDEDGRLLLLSEQFEIRCSPVCHLIPTLGLRFNNRKSGKSVAYSCDSEPCTSVIELSEGAEILFHEAVGEMRGHSSPRQAGETARRAQVKKLVLIHYPAQIITPEEWEEEARREFDGVVELAYDFMEESF